MDWLIDWLIDFDLIDWLIDWLTDAKTMKRKQYMVQIHALVFLGCLSPVYVTLNMKSDVHIVSCIGM